MGSILRAQVRFALSPDWTLGDAEARLRDDADPAVLRAARARLAARPPASSLSPAVVRVLAALDRALAGAQGALAGRSA